MNIVICDDEYHICEQLASILHKMDSKLNIKLFSSDSKFLDYVENTACGEIDVVFMDINLNPNTSDKNGIECAKRLYEKYPKIQIVFITGYCETYLSSLFYKYENLKFCGILPKPFNESDVKGIFERSRKTIEKNWIQFKALKGSTVYFEIEDLIYIESQRRYTVVHTEYGEYTGHGKLLDFKDKLPGYFFLCNKSCIVNIKKIDAVHDNSIILNNIEISLSKFGGTTPSQKRQEINDLKVIYHNW